MAVVVPGTIPSLPTAFDLKSSDLVLVYQPGQTPSTRAALVSSFGISTFPEQDANRFFASPPDASGAPVFRSLLSSDVTGALGFSPVQTVAGRSGEVTLGTGDIVGFASAASAAAPVQTVAGRSGAVSLVVADISGAAPLADPEFSGTVRAPAVTTTGDATIGGSIDATGTVTAASLTIRGTKVNIASLPTSNDGLSAGDIWNNGGVLCVV